MSAAPLRIGTRGSALALWQAERVAALIRAQDGAPAVELVRVKTEGDARTDVPLWQLGGQAFFTREIDRRLGVGEIDIAVHSLKDLPTILEPGLALTAVLEREDPRDALLMRSGTGLGDLPQGARVGTSSLRRRAFLARSRTDLTLLELRGNVPTRIERLDAGDYDAIVLAAAGLKRLGLEARISAYLDPAQFTPAVSQGAIGVCTRSIDAHASRWVAALDHQPTRLATVAERALLRRIEAGCQVPLGALGRCSGNTLHLHAIVCALDGSDAIAAESSTVLGSGPQLGAAALGLRLAEELLARGAERLIETKRPPIIPEPP
jgi:hydroxymethylbilane synthase